jgi:ribonuclease E
MSEADTPEGGTTDAVTAEDSAMRARRRGRRGGRRRRREPGDDVLPAVAALDAEQPDLLDPTPYRGPTPADPFGGRSFDIFDVMDQVERAAERPTPTEPPSPEAPIETVMVETVMAEPVFVEPVLAEPVMAELVLAEPEPHAPVAAEPEPIVPEAPEAIMEPVLAAPANDVVEAPAIRPIVIGSAEAAPIEKKRGWWRR